MPRLRLVLVLLIAALGLSACGTAQPTPYQPATRSGGYAERPIAGGIFEVTFRGNSVTSREQVESYAMYRAAEIAAGRGADRFALLDKTLHANRQEIREYDPWPRYYGYGSRSGVALGYSVPLYAAPRTYHYTIYVAELLIRPLPPGVDPPEAAPLFSVPDLLQSIGPTIRRPAPPA